MRTLISLITLNFVLGHGSPKPPIDPNHLATLCQSNWGKFRGEINSAERPVRDWIQSLNRNQVSILYDAEDQLVFFGTLYFPRVFENRFDGVEFFNQCFGLNANLLRDMSDRSVDHTQEVEVLKGCLLARFSKWSKTRAPTLVPPFDRIIRCYESQSKQFRN